MAIFPPSLMAFAEYETDTFNPAGYEVQTKRFWWWFDLAPGDVWAMPGDDGSDGYTRWYCTHGLPLLIELGSDEECRISLNIRCG